LKASFIPLAVLFFTIRYFWPILIVAVVVTALAWALSTDESEGE
jgi:hypothetical protein